MGVAEVVPGPRDLTSFVLAGKTDGWMGALEQMRVFCDQNVEDREKDWKFIQEHFAINWRLAHGETTLDEPPRAALCHLLGLTPPA